MDRKYYHSKGGVGGEEGECQQMMVMILFPKFPLFIFRDPPPPLLFSQLLKQQSFYAAPLYPLISCFTAGHSWF